MHGFTLDNLVLLVIAIGLIWVCVKFITGVLKTVITVILVLTIGVSAYNIFIARKPLSHEVDRYKTDFVYLRQVKDINKQASDAMSEIKDNKNRDSNLKKLDSLLAQAEGLKHSDESKLIHDTYISNFKKVVTGARAYEAANDAKDKLDDLKELEKNLNVKLTSLMFGSR